MKKLIAALIASMFAIGAFAAETAASAPEAAASAPVKAKAAKKGKRGKRGSVGNKVLGGLQAAGAAGITVPELAANTGIKAGSLHAWFATTGKNHVERVARGRYRIKQAEQAQHPQEAQEG